jgi:hypothetical protein
MTPSTRYPAPDFIFTTGELDGSPVVAVINAGLAGYEHCREFPWQVQLTIHATETDEQGLPTVEEADQINATEERLHEALAPLGAHLVARQTLQGRRLVDFYVTDAPEARQRVEQLVRAGTLPRQVTLNASRDDDWAIWMPTLLRICPPAGVATHADAFDQAVLVRIPLHGGEFGSDEEQQAVFELADKLAEIAADADAEFDGNEFGNGEATLFAYGRDADRLFAALEPALRRASVARGATIVRRYGSHDDARQETITL